MKEILNDYKWFPLTLLLSLVLGVIDWLTGYHLNFYVFYFLPVFLAAWFLGKPGAVILSIICSLVWFGADFMTRQSDLSDLYAVWNTMIRLVSFLAIGWAVSLLKHALDTEKEISEQLRVSLSEIKVLKAFLPICAQCKKIRDEDGAWEDLEDYLSKHANTRFSHGYCPDCYKRAMADARLLSQ